MVDYSLYLCTESDINKNITIENCVEEAIRGGVTFVQIREKNKSPQEKLEISKQVKKIADKYNIPLVINDSVDIALDIGADGVHLGQDDMTCKEARNLLGPNKIIGITVHNTLEAKKAMEDGADYLGVGAIYKSNTKPDAVVVGHNMLDEIVKISNIPIVVIGGINENTIPDFKGKNIAGYAMISPILNKSNITQSAIQIKNIIKNN